MAKLIKILAASVGGGLVLGAGIRLGEAIATWDSDAPPHSQKLARRLGELETRLENLEGEGAEVTSSVQAQAEAVSAARSKLDLETRHIESLSETSFQLRGELQGWLEASVATHMAEVEARLRAEAERGQKQMLDVFVENVQTRVIQRISHLEDEVAGQSAAVSELRECSLRTERSIQKLLAGLDRVVVKPLAAEPPPGGFSGHAPFPAPEKPVKEHLETASPEPAPPPPAFTENPSRSSRWKIFG